MKNPYEVVGKICIYYDGSVFFICRIYKNEVPAEVDESRWISIPKRVARVISPEFVYEVYSEDC